MIDNNYRNAFKEVYIILENTDSQLLERIPNKFKTFIKDNMNVDYHPNIKPDIPIDKQKLLKETDGILSLIFRSYWATEEEKIDFINKDKKEFIENEEKKKLEFEGKSIDEIFDKRKKIDKIIINDNLMVIKKDNFLKRIFKFFSSIFKKN